METILKANRIPFSGLDLATDEKARMLWGRRAGKDAQGRQRKLPALVQEGLVVGVSAHTLFTSGKEEGREVKENGIKTRANEM